MLDYVLQIALVQMFAIQIKVSPTCSPLQPAGSLAQAKFWQRSYISCVENREETALVFRDFAGTTHTRADFANSFFQKIYLLLSKTLLTMQPQFSYKTKKPFFVSELITRLTVTDQS